MADYLKPNANNICYIFHIMYLEFGFCDEKQNKMHQILQFSVNFFFSCRNKLGYVMYLVLIFETKKFKKMQSISKPSKTLVD